MNDDRDRSVEAWLRHTLFFDIGDGEEGTRDDAAQRVLAEVYRRSQARDDARRRRRRRLLGGSIIAGVMVSGSAVAAVVWWSGQPSRPEALVLCHSTAELGGDVIAIPPGDEPADGCGRLWADGQLPTRGTSAQVPPLAVCVGAGGAIEVFPGDNQVCAALGLSGADSTLSTDNSAVVALQERLVEEVNLADCRPVPEVVAIVEQMLAESDMSEWTVTITPDAESGTCGKVAVDTTNQTVLVVNEF